MADHARTVSFAAAATAALTAAARIAWPREMVGVVAGTRRAEHFHVTRFVNLPNIALTGDRFQVPAPAFAAVEAALRRDGVEFLGFAHSHPNGEPTPSEIDCRELWPHCLQVLVGIPGDGAFRIACWWLDDRRVPNPVHTTTADDALAVHGFAIHDGVLSPAEVDRIVRDITTMPLLRSRAGVRHAMQHAPIAQLAEDRRLLAIASSALGATAIPFRATVFAKTPLQNWLVVWHQDTALPLRERRECEGFGPWSEKAGVVYAHAPTAALTGMVALRVHLDVTTAANGALRVLPGTHLLGVQSDEEVHRIANGGEHQPMDCEVQRGGVMAMRPLLIHASSKSHTDTPRRVLHFEYAASLDLGSGLGLAMA